LLAELGTDQVVGGMAERVDARRDNTRWGHTQGTVADDETLVPGDLGEAREG